MNLIEFAVEMQRKLDDNAHKPGWDRDTFAALIKRLRQEVDELERATSRRGLIKKEIVKEAADVANFAYFIADNATREP